VRGSMAAVLSRSPGSHPRLFLSLPPVCPDDAAEPHQLQRSFDGKIVPVLAYHSSCSVRFALVMALADRRGFASAATTPNMPTACGKAPQDTLMIQVNDQ
jgi:hypothetical protein